METTAAGGRATPEYGNATGFNRWIFTFIAILNSGKNPLLGSGKSCINSNSKLVCGTAVLILHFSGCIDKRGIEGLQYEQMAILILIVVY